MIRLSLLFALWLFAAADGDVLKVAGIERIQQINESLLVGSTPSSESFQKLRKEAGVTVVLSVDGRFPDVKGAREAGLRVVHLPLGYDGIEPERLRSFKRLIAEEEGPIFVHCHRGIHRGPAAAAILWMLRGHGSPEQAREILVQAGTSPRYQRLWEAVENFIPPVGDCSEAPLPARVEVDGLAAVMIEIDRARSNLGRHVQSQPDIAPEHEALILVEHLREMERLDPGGHAARDKDFRSQLIASRRAAEALAARTDVGQEAWQRALEKLDATCTACHLSHRN